MDPGGDHSRDDYELPPADIDIPDDARELDRDVLAYHRELRARRRHRRLRRIASPFTQHGMVIPLVAACLALTLLTGSLLSVLTGRQPAPRDQAAASNHPSPQAGQDAGRLPDAPVRLNHRLVSLRILAPAVFAWVPPSCSCDPELMSLAAQATKAGVRTYFVGTGAAIGQVAAVAGPAPASLVEDDGNVLEHTYGFHGLAVILAGGGGVVASQDVLKTLPPPSRLAARLRSIAPAGRSAEPAPQAS